MPKLSTPARGSTGIRERYGMDPEIRYFHTAAVTDNSVDAVRFPPRRTKLAVVAGIGLL